MSSDDDTLMPSGKNSARPSKKTTGFRGDLPAGESPGEHSSLEDKRSELIAKIEELSGALRYMGDGHPRKKEMAAQLETMKKMLDQMNQAMKR